MLQKIDKELETALATLEKEKEEALKDLDAQVFADASQCLLLPVMSASCLCRLASFLERFWRVCFPRVSSSRGCLTLFGCKDIEKRTCACVGSG